MAKGPIPAPPRTAAAPGPQLVQSSQQSTAPIEVTGAESIVLSLEATGTEVVFGIPGGAILPTYDPLMSSKKLRHILVRHEQGGGHAKIWRDRKSTRLNSSHVAISYAVFCLKKKNNIINNT